ncbi:hypothetical protein DPMN_056603 [Dreissena polymorpha]|uniref:CWH43-like N-terminal domain-containing protein n=1 Tax=Dreissena polymorpha TaxID=45954 RepID=A0A9D4CUQ4_DREPO|nr:hypothetical protein DPMN_056603 [Dreissena polymorpha]
MISTAIGGFTPQRYVWTICISLTAGLRFLLAYCYFHWHLRVNMGAKHLLYKNLVTVAVCFHILENVALIVLTAISSTDNEDIHEKSFIPFIVCSEIYMIMYGILIHWTHRSKVVTPSSQILYSWFALCEYLTVFSNIAFHSIACVDFSMYSFTIVHT